jgi:nitrite reductase/ring-hydroxylating ferredoxin subunit
MRSAAIAIGGLVALFPFVAGWGVLFNPLRRQAAGGEKFVRIGPLDLVPADGIPRQFSVSAEMTDAWARSPAQRIGSVFLSRTQTADGPKIIGLSSVCPHLGCAVDYDIAAGEFECPCHASAFAKDGAKLFGPSLRGLDPLPVKLVKVGSQQEIWVEPERFRPGIAERVPTG